MMLTAQRTFAGGAAASLTAPWPIMGVRIDNYSAQFLQVAGQQIFVTPYTIGATFPLSGAGSVAIAPGVPGPSVAQANPQTGDTYIVTLYSEPVGMSGGLPYAAPAALAPINWQEVAAAAFTAQQLGAGFSPSLIASPARMIGIKAKATNAGVIWIGFNSIIFASNIQGYPLSANQSIALAVTPVGTIWWSADVINDRISVILLR